MWQDADFLGRRLQRDEMSRRIIVTMDEVLDKHGEFFSFCVVAT